jgi:hypothetical protein
LLPWSSPIDVGVLEDRRDLVLARRHFVVAGLDRDADLEELGFAFHHAGEDAIGDRAEVLVLELLALGRLGAEQGTAGVDQVGACVIEVGVDQEIFLLGAAGRGDPLGARAEQLQDADRLRRQRFHRAQQRRLLVERLTGPADERGRDDQRHAVRVGEQPRRAGRIPGRVATGFERRAHAAGREARGVGLALDQFLAAELGDGAAFGRRREKRVVLFRRDPGQRLEPVGVVRRAMLERPILDRRSNRVGNRVFERFALGDGATQGLVHLLGETRALHVVAEDEAAEDLGGPPL